jgi:hypothetical protein
MALSRICQSLVFASLLLACGRTQPPARSAERPAPQDEYVTLIPEVTYSRTGQDVASDDAQVSPDDDVMASILAIPPGAPSRHAPCTDCRVENRQ